MFLLGPELEKQVPFECCLQDPKTPPFIGLSFKDMGNFIMLHSKKVLMPDIPPPRKAEIVDKQLLIVVLGLCCTAGIVAIILIMV